MTLQILGMGCRNCRVLAERTEQAARELGLDCEVERVTDLERISQSHIMSVPALVVDGEVKLVGRVPSVDAIKALLTCK